ncbi:histidinol-phosphate phosphatase [Agreia bicolorata]|uniref:Histidinol-phosphatase n=1 Tax=Agreia bicolorata TaxID=110935 RepID=A0A1T4XB89_9MICO|nr:histidinol-phosphatase [Agreia bicolorata]SKA86830.1 histidinol-phosphate phosphatase [Agreia bicolorata]
MTVSYADDLALALDIANAADRISLDRFMALDLVVEKKPDRTPVTDADKAVEREIRDRLAEARPGDSILGEEYGAEGDSSRQWIVDPIDGTANYLRGVPVWATLISLAIDGVPVVGVVSSPALGRRWWAASGEGAWMSDQTLAANTEPRRLQVSRVAGLADASISYNSLKGWDEAGRLESLLSLSRSVWRTRAYGEMWSYMLVAEGALDVAGEFDLQPYDMAALIPVIEEAGGRFTSVDGTSGPWSGSALASNGLLHDDALRVLSE